MGKSKIPDPAAARQRRMQRSRSERAEPVAERMCSEEAMAERRGGERSDPTLNKFVLIVPIY